MRIAPRLVALSRIRPDVAQSDDDWRLAEDWEGQARELRALLAVARAAARGIKPFLDSQGKSLGGGHAASCSCKLCRALASLERVSKVKP